MIAQPTNKKQFFYKPHYKPNQLICGTGQIAIVTGWTRTEALAKHLPPQKFAVIGNLYSPTRGISPLIRNLLANPHVRYVIILDATKEDKHAGGCRALSDFFRRNVKKGISEAGKSCWVIDSKIKGYIDIEIENTALTTLQDNLTLFTTTSIDQCIEVVETLYELSIEQGTWKAWGDPLIFPDPVITFSIILPGSRYGHRIEGKTIAETWVKILHRIKTTGTIRPTGYDGKWQELIDLVAVITDEPQNFYFPDPNYLPIDRPFLTEYIPQILNDAPYKEGVKYTYGQRLRSWFGQDQIEQVIEKLVNEIDAASAVMSLWDSGSGGVQDDNGGLNRGKGDSDHDHSGSPCLNHIWVRVVPNSSQEGSGELSLTATLRSNDMFAAWPANAMGLRALQQHIRDKIAAKSDYDLQMGPLIIISQSAHIYDDTWENVDRLIATQYAKICQQRDYYDPSGNFLIEVESDKIIVKQTTPGSGEVVASYSGKTPLKLVREICTAVPAIHPEHIGYLGIELEKAHKAITGETIYSQDKS